jgi:hypothetical protein
MKNRYRIFDTVSLEVISETNRYAEARQLQKVYNSSPCAAHGGNGYVVRFALQDARYPRRNALPEPELVEVSK